MSLIDESYEEVRLRELGAAASSAENGITRLKGLVRSAPGAAGDSVAIAVSNTVESLRNGFSPSITDGITCSNYPNCRVHNSCIARANATSAVASASSAASVSASISPSSRSLFDMVRSISNQDLVEAGMKGDDVEDANGNKHTWTPEDQFKYCLDLKPIDENALALCLYTSYFYGPINASLRNPAHVFPNSVSQILTPVKSLLNKAINDSPVVDTNKYRVELDASWIGRQFPGIEMQVGLVLTFPGFTSTHPTEQAMDNMADDINSGKFGTPKELAILVFVGAVKCINTAGATKYFPTESELILPPLTAQLVNYAPVTWNGKSMFRYTLQVLPEKPQFGKRP